MSSPIDYEKCRISPKEWKCPVEACEKILSRRQTLQDHLGNIHGIHVQHKTYKEYENQDSIAIPRTTAWRLQKRKHDEMEDMSTSNMSNKSICQGTPCSNTAADDSIQEQSSYTAADESIQEQSSYTAADESIQEQSSYTAADESIQEQSSYTAADESIQEQSSYTATDRSHYSGSEITNTVSYPRVEPIQQNDLANDINNSEFDTDLNELGSDMDIENSDSSNSEDEIKNSELDIFDDDGGDYDDYNDNDKTILNNTLSSTPLYVIPSQNNHFESPITYEDHILTVNAYASRHHLSDSAYTDLLNLLQLHLPDNSLLDTNINKMKEQCGFNLDHLNFHTFCTICENVFQNKNEQCQTPGCNGRRKSSRNSNYFVTGNIDKQLKDVLTKSGMWQSIQERANSTPSADVITDIVDGSEYKKLKQEGQFLNNSNNISVSFFTDGIPLFKSSGVSLWPVYLLINEIPRKERFLKKNMLLWGIWQGSGKPNMTIFLKSLVSDLQKLYNEGIVFHIEGKPICSKVILLVGTMDLPARAGVLNMTQYNGEYACIFCLHPGVVVKSGKGHCRSFPYREEPKRTTTETRLHAEEAHNTRKRVKGMLGISVLNFLPYYSLCEYIVVDYMHGILLGICKKLLGMWFNATSADKPYFIGTKIKEVDKLLKNIKPPYLINRLPRKLSNTLHHWKASELRSWLLFYAIPCLRDFLPDLYLKHFSTLVEATYILLGEGISTQDLDRADLLLITFVKSAECLYGKQFMGLNVHNLLHLVDCVKKWGPLWAWSCFCFESFNGEIKQGIHGTGNVCRGIFWSIHAEKFIHSMIASDDNTCTRKSNTKEFLKHLNSGHLMAESKTTAANQCQVLHAKEISENFPYFKDICDQLEIITGDKSRKDFLKAPKIIRNGYVMYSKLCTKVKKRNSFCVRSMEGNTCKYMEVEYYLLHPASGRVFAVGSNLTVIGNVLDNRVPHIKEIKLDRNGYIVKKVELLMDVMVTTTVQRKTYISAMPNTIERN